MSVAKKLQTIAENMTKVYESGANAGSGGNYDEGYQTGYAEGVLAGQENQYNDFWDAYQQNGNRTHYANGFGGEGWTDETFKPKYDMAPVHATRMFANSLITNLKQILESRGITLDFSKATSATYPFDSSSVTEVGVLDFSSIPNMSYFLNGVRSIKYIEKLVLNSNGNQTFNATTSFGYCIALEHMIVEGVIGQNNFDVHWSPLDVESLVSIMNALQDKTTDTSGTVWKVTIGATNKAKLSDSELKIASDKGWSVE